MYQLLQRDPKNRLGSYTGANEIKQHPFFRGVNWTLIRDKVTTISIMNIWMLLFYSIFCRYFFSFPAAIANSDGFLQSPPKLEVPVQFTTESEDEVKIVDPDLADLQTNIF